jgi:hypothetical protein
MKQILAKAKTLVPAIALGTVLASCGSGLPGGSSEATYTQIERLARPAVNEGLILSNANLNLFNAVPPSIDLSDAAAGVRTEAIGTLTAVANLGIQVFNALTGGNLLSDANFAQGATTAAGVATIHALQFVPDVMRISVADADTSNPGDPDVGGTTGDGRVGYLKCLNTTTGLGPNPTGPLLCGGRKIRDNVVGITLNYLALGATYVTQTFQGYSGGGGYAAAGSNYLVWDGYKYSTTHTGAQAWGGTGFPYLPPPYISQ